MYFGFVSLDSDKTVPRNSWYHETLHAAQHLVKAKQTHFSMQIDTNLAWKVQNMCFIMHKPTYF